MRTSTHAQFESRVNDKVAFPIERIGAAYVIGRNGKYGKSRTSIFHDDAACGRLVGSVAEIPVLADAEGKMWWQTGKYHKDGIAALAPIRPCKLCCEEEEWKCRVGSGKHVSSVMFR